MKTHFDSTYRAFVICDAVNLFLSLFTLDFVRQTFQETLLLFALRSCHEVVDFLLFGVVPAQLLHLVVDPCYRKNVVEAVLVNCPPCIQNHLENRYELDFLRAHSNEGKSVVQRVVSQFGQFLNLLLLNSFSLVFSPVEFFIVNS